MKKKVDDILETWKIFIFFFFQLNIYYFNKKWCIIDLHEITSIC